MENFSKNDSDNENEESKKIINNFKSELEKIKQKLGKNYIQKSQVAQGKNITNFHFHKIINDKIENNKIYIFKKWLNIYKSLNIDKHKIEPK